MKRTQKNDSRRGRSRRRRRAGSYPIQLAAAISVVALAGWMLVSLLGKVAHPYWLRYDYGSKVATLKEDLHQRRARNADLRARIQYMLSEEGAETAARRAGWQRPGEKVYYVRNASAKPQAGEASSHGR